MRLFGLEDRWTTVEGNRVYARVGEAGGAPRPAIVLLHGVGLSSRYMVPLARHLRRHLDVYALDFPGFGWSGKSREPPTVQEQADDLRKWMDAVGLRHASLLGNALGSQVAIDFAYRFPERVDKLVLTGASPDPRSRNVARLYSWQLMNMPFEPPPMQLIYMLDTMQTGIVRMLKTMDRTCDDPIETKLPSIRAETLVIRGKYDQVVPQSWAEYITHLLPRGKLVVVDRAAHCAHFSRAAQVARLTMELVLAQTTQRTATQPAA